MAREMRPNEDETFSPPRRVNVLGVGISALNMASAVQCVMAALRQPELRGYVCVTGVHGVMESQDDPTLVAIHNESLLTTPDGMPMVWMGRLQGFRQMRRVYGPDLMLAVCRATGSQYSHFLYGGAPGVAEQLRDSLAELSPGIRIVGTFTPPFRALTPTEERELISHVNGLAPDIIWVGLSTPKQERFMATYITQFRTRVMFGVGAAFDFHTGRVRQAPGWMQRSGLEWLFRVLVEPKRLWRRYLRNNPRFILRSLAQLTGLRKYPPV
jgi:N-acetylglucosaminyldiphosphoundecaprenol N-acetyl-beta-D-mannosaminyltransferase